MKLIPLALEGAFLVKLVPIEDERGYFARAFCAQDFESRGLEPVIAQCNISYNPHRGTVRGLHYQQAPHEEVKLVRCIQGKCFDVLVDLRTSSQTYRKWVSVELDSESLDAVYIPKGFAHGFQTLVEDTTLFYQMSTPYVPNASRTVAFDDPALKIPWPVSPVIVSDKDRFTS